MKMFDLRMLFISYMYRFLYVNIFLEIGVFHLHIPFGINYFLIYYLFMGVGKCNLDYSILKIFELITCYISTCMVKDEYLLDSVSFSFFVHLIFTITVYLVRYSSNI